MWLREVSRLGDVFDYFFCLSNLWVGCLFLFVFFKLLVSVWSTKEELSSTNFVIL